MSILNEPNDKQSEGMFVIVHLVISRLQNSIRILLR